MIGRIYHFSLITYRHSLSDEPITKTFRDESLQSKEEKEFFDNSYFYDLIKQGVSLIVIDPQADDKVIGMRVSGCCKRLVIFRSPLFHSLAQV